jgi:outer membrane protein TolC
LGRRLAAEPAAREQARASDADLATVRLSLQPRLQSIIFEVRSADAQKKLLDDTRVAPKADVAEAETQLNTTRVKASDIMVQRAQYEHALAILIGKPPAEFSLPVAPQPAVSKASSSSRRRPAELLERRPDVATAERRMAAANEQIGIAKALTIQVSALQRWAVLKVIPSQTGSLAKHPHPKHQPTQAQRTYRFSAPEYRRSPDSRNCANS